MLLDLDVGPDHDSNHYPEPEDDDTWQESWAFAWFDPVKDISGWHHSSIKRREGVVDVKSWVCVRGRMAHGFQTWTLPVPDADHTDLHLGPIHIQALEPLRRHRISIADTDLDVSLVTEPLVGPHWYSRKAMELQSGKKAHWESYNRFDGVVIHGGETIEVNGFGFLSRSWGPRDLRTLLTFRLLWATFGEDLTIRCLMPTTTEGRKAYGFAVDRGRLLPFTDMRLDVTMSMDGVNPLGCTGTFWTEAGGYRLRGDVSPGHAQTNTHPFDAMYSHGSCVFELGGRLGTGFLQVNELKRPAPWDVQRLGL